MWSGKYKNVIGLSQTCFWVSYRDDNTMVGFMIIENKSHGHTLLFLYDYKDCSYHNIATYDILFW
jgi:hypothetical protein